MLGMTVTGKWEALTRSRGHPGFARRSEWLPEGQKGGPGPCEIAGIRRGPILVQGGIHSIYRQIRLTLEVVLKEQEGPGPALMYLRKAAPGPFACCLD
jgi:hypothetical protein